MVDKPETGVLSMSLPKGLGLPGVVAIVSVLCGCQTIEGIRGAQRAAPRETLHQQAPKHELTTAPRRYMALGLEALEARDYKNASKHLNLALKADITDSHLQFLNALAYHLRGLDGESGLLPLARTGYELAARFDSSNWLAYYYLGLLYLDQRKYARAQAKLAEAALYKKDDPDLLYDLALASYYAKDPKTAAAALGAMRGLQSGQPDDPAAMRASAIVSAALNQPGQARKFLARYRAAEANPDAVRTIQNRIVSWDRLYVRKGPQLLAQLSDDGIGDSSMGDEQMGAGQDDDLESGPGFVDSKMVVVDVVIIGSQEDITSSFGVNLLQGLKLQFGDPSSGTPGISVKREKVTDSADATNNLNQRTFTRLISAPAVTYSLNIANAANLRNEILARPTLVALSGVTSEFFSGVDITGAAVSGGDGDSVAIEKEVGVKLSVTPEFLPDGLVKLGVVAERTFLTTPSKSVVFDFRLDTTKTVVNANVVMRFGETLILSGLSEKEIERNRDGVPFLQDIPLLQYAFSKRQTRDFLRSVLILLTPRRTQYVSQSEDAATGEQESLSDRERTIKEFEDQYREWFKPLPTTASIFRHLRDSSVYREFRTGDLTMKSWNSQRSHEQRIKSAIQLLYY